MSLVFQVQGSQCHRAPPETGAGHCGVERVWDLQEKGAEEGRFYARFAPMLLLCQHFQVLGTQDSEALSE